MPQKHPPAERARTVLHFPSFASSCGVNAALPPNARPRRSADLAGVQSEAGKRYDIEATETPGVPSSWVPVATNLDGTALVDFTDTLATSRQARFYRVIER